MGKNKEKGKKKAPKAYSGIAAHKRQRKALILPLGPTTHAAAALDQAMAIEHRMDGALGRDRNSRESAQQALANLAGTPARVLALHVQDEVFHLKGKLIRIAVGASASVREPLHPTLLVATEDFVARLARNPKLPAEIRHWLAR